MFKLKNKKGFTLIEMLAVIAVIAVLVSVVVPTVTGSTDKAAAAANAANLRSVEGELTTMRLISPADFDMSGSAAVGQLNTELKDMQQQNASEKQAYKNAQDNIEALQGNVTNLQNTINNAQKIIDEGAAAKTSLEAAQKTLDSLNSRLPGAQQTLKDAQDKVDSYNSTATLYDDALRVYEEGVKLFGADSKLVKKSKETLDKYASQLQNIGNKKILEAAVVTAQNTVNKIEDDIVSAQQELETNRPEWEAAINKAASENYQEIIDNTTPLLEAAVKEVEKAQTTLDAYANDYFTKADQNIANKENEIYDAMYKFTAENGVITLPSGTEIVAPASKQIKKGAAAIDKDVQMVVYVTADGAVATYNGLSISDFVAATKGDAE